MRKLFQYLLFFLGLSDCVHDYGSWKEELVDKVFTDTNKTYKNVATGYQTRTCTKCNFKDRRYI